MIPNRWPKKKMAAIRTEMSKQVMGTEAIPGVEPGNLTVGVRVAELCDAMEPSLRLICQQIRSHVADAERADTGARHRIAVLVSQVVNGAAKWGTGAVKQIGEATGISEKCLYRWARVGECWPTPEAINSIVRLRNIYGLPLSWSHLEVIAEVRDEEQRESLVNLALSKNFSVRELRRTIAKTRPADARYAPSDSEPNLAASLHRLAKDAKATIKSQAGCRDVLDHLNDANESPELNDALSDALYEMLKLRDTTNATIGALESAVQMLARAHEETMVATHAASIAEQPSPQ